MTPMPPACAMAIAMWASVTVSMAEAMIGMFNETLRVIRDRISTSDGITSERAGLQQHIVEGVSFAQYAFGSHCHCQLRIVRIGGPAHRVDAWRTSGLKSLARLDGPLLGWRRSIARIGYK